MGWELGDGGVRWVSAEGPRRSRWDEGFVDDKG